MEIQQTLGDTVTFVGVPGSTDLSSLNDFIDRTGSTGIAHVVDGDRELWERFEVERRQTYMLITSNGSVERVEFNDLSSRLSTLS